MPRVLLPALLCAALIACGGFNPTFDITPDQLLPGVPFPVWDGTEESMRDMLTTIVFRTEALSDDLVRMRNESALAQRESLAAASAWNARALTDPGIGQAHRLLGHLDRLTVPIIYLYGRQDVLSPVENAYLQEDLLPNVQFLYPDQCGHQAQTDQPDLLNAAFAEWFAHGSLTRATPLEVGGDDRRCSIRLARQEFSGPQVPSRGICLGQKSVGGIAK